MRIAYADPPYIGQARKHYGNEPTYAGEVDHRELITRLDRDYDGWALSLSAPSLFDIVPLVNQVCETRPRVGAWVKPWASWKPGVNPAYAWEPVIFKPARQLGRGVPTCRDWVSANVTLKRGLSGIKPDAFCFWLFTVLGMQAGDDFDDLYPGSSAVTRAWQTWQGQFAAVLF